MILFFMVQSCSNQCKNKFDEIVEQEKVAKTIDACIGWAKTKDLDLLYSVVTQDSSYVSVHPSDRVVYGFEQFKEAVPFWMDDNFQYVKHEIKDLNITFSKSGNVAWFYCKLSDMNTWKGQPANWENTRWTGVLEKLDENWVICQQHFSFASS